MYLSDITSYRLKLPSGECHKASLMISQHWFRQRPGAMGYETTVMTQFYALICRHQATMAQTGVTNTLSAHNGRDVTQDRCPIDITVRVVQRSWMAVDFRYSSGTIVATTWQTKGILEHFAIWIYILREFPHNTDLRDVLIMNIAFKLAWCWIG